MVAVFAGIALLLALGPIALFLRNLRVFKKPSLPSRENKSLPAVSILIPARNEARAIQGAVDAARQSVEIDFEIIVLDDHSEDSTPGIVRSIASHDARVRLIEGPPLPEGWCGKQHACWVLAQSARHPILAFLDADVRVATDGLARMVGFLSESRADLVSGIPHQITGSFVERLVIPLIHFVLLGFLPLGRMRRGSHPAYGAGCGQLFVARRDAYDAAGGHQAIRGSLHDGVTLPRAFRAAGRRTDLCDATDVATCRMYRGAGELWRGLAKNACEGAASPALILPTTALLFGGQVLPFVLLPISDFDSALARTLALVGCVAAYVPRWIAAHRFRQSWVGAFLHPLSILVFLAIQWYAFIRRLAGRPSHWKARTYTSPDRPVRPATSS
jgi:hypothetical protein